MSKQMTVQDDAAQIVDKYAKQAGVTPAEALDRFLRMGISRHNALAKYANAQTAPAKPAKKAPAKAAPAKGKGKKAK